MTSQFESAVEIASQAVRDGLPAIVIDGVPGSGKTEVLLFCAAAASAEGQSTIIVCNTAVRVRNVAEALARRFPKLVPSKRLVVGQVDVLTGDELFKRSSDSRAWNLMILDDAWNLDDVDFALIAPLADRFVLIGDRERTRPLERPRLYFQSPPAFGIAAPDALVARPWIRALEVSIHESRRLPQDSAQVISSVFYPSSPFRGVADYPSRAIELPDKFEISNSAEVALATAAAGITLIGCEMPVKAVHNAVDASMTAAACALALRLLDCKGMVTVAGVEHAITPEDVGIIVCDEVQRMAVSDLLPAQYGLDIRLVKEARGFEKPFIIALIQGVNLSVPDMHDVDDLAVMTSRHLVANFVFFRPRPEEFQRFSGMLGPVPLLKYDSVTHKAATTSAHLFAELGSHTRRVRVPEYDSRPI